MGGGESISPHCGGRVLRNQKVSQSAVRRTSSEMSYRPDKKTSSYVSLFCFIFCMYDYGEISLYVGLSLIYQTLFYSRVV